MKKEIETGHKKLIKFVIFGIVLLLLAVILINYFVPNRYIIGNSQDPTTLAHWQYTSKTYNFKTEKRNAPFKRTLLTMQYLRARIARLDRELPNSLPPQLWLANNHNLAYLSNIWGKYIYDAKRLKNYDNDAWGTAFLIDGKNRTIWSAGANRIFDHLGSPEYIKDDLYISYGANFLIKSVQLNLNRDRITLEFSKPLQKDSIVVKGMRIGNYQPKEALYQVKSAKVYNTDTFFSSGSLFSRVEVTLHQSLPINSKLGICIGGSVVATDCSILGLSNTWVELEPEPFPDSFYDISAYIPSNASLPSTRKANKESSENIGSAKPLGN